MLLNKYKIYSKLYKATCPKYFRSSSIDVLIEPLRRFFRSSKSKIIVNIDTMMIHENPSPLWNIESTIKSLWIAWTNVKHFDSLQIGRSSLGRGEYIALRIPPFYIQSCTVWKEIKFGRLGKKWVDAYPSPRELISRVECSLTENFSPPLNATRVPWMQTLSPRSRLSHPIYGSRNRTCAISGMLFSD